MDPNVEEIDLAALAAKLRGAFEHSPPSGYVRGRTALRAPVAEHLGCSEAAAERIVDTMVGRGFLRFDGDPTTADDSDATWTVVDTP